MNSTPYWGSPAMGLHVYRNLTVTIPTFWIQFVCDCLTLSLVNYSRISRIYLQIVCGACLYPYGLNALSEQKVWFPRWFSNHLRDETNAFHGKIFLVGDGNRTLLATSIHKPLYHSPPHKEKVVDYHLQRLCSTVVSLSYYCYYWHRSV